MMRPTSVVLASFLMSFGLLAAAAVALATRQEPSALFLVIGSSVIAAGSTVALWALSARRLRVILEMAERLHGGELGVMVERPGDGLLGALERSFNAVSEKLSETHDAATIDRLTQVSNRGTILSSLFSEVERAVRHTRPLSVAFVDLDHFKSINDTHGHQAGDIVLRGVAQLFKTNLRVTDLIGRYGGEEFMIVLPETGPEAAVEVAEKLRLRIARERFAVSDTVELSVTVSIGIAGGSGKTLRAESLVQDADQAMYGAKSLGRNQTYVFAEPDEDARVPRAPIHPAGRVRALEVASLARRAAETALTAAISPRPHYGGKPSSLIATIAVALAMDLELPEQEIERIRLASLLHDIGKIALPDHILDKPAPLTTSEWEFVRQHPRIGQLILDESGSLRETGKIILHHHERFGGHGYPHGLRGREIPLGSRIVSVADAYEAMTHDRPYKRAISHEDSIAELNRYSATQFDPELVARFVRRFGDVPPVANESLVAPTPELPIPVTRASRRRASA
jgi:diguanylate cyclase (GGDEF)-like protein